MDQQHECDTFHSFTRDGSVIPKKIIYEFSSNDDSSDSDNRKRKRVWKKSESSSKFKSHRKCFAHKFKPYNVKSIVSNVNYRNSKSDYEENSKKFSLGLPRTTIELKNIPTEMNNILLLYQCFSQFGEITLIQINRNNDSRALLSFRTILEATRAVEKASSVIPNINASWFVDYCLLKQFPKKNTVKNNDVKIDSISFESTLKSENFESMEPFYNTFKNISKPYRKPADVVNSISNLIKMKNKLLLEQLNSRNEIVDKLAKCEFGSEKEKKLLILLKKVQEQIDDNRRSIEYSLKQKTEIFSNYSDPQASSSNQDSNDQTCKLWIESFENSQKGDERESDFIPISLLSYGISFDKCEEIGLDNERNEENYFSSRSYGYTINVCSPKKP